MRGLRRLGKRIVIELDDGHFVVIHLMIAGRLHWAPAAADGSAARGKGVGRIGVAGPRNV